MDHVDQSDLDRQYAPLAGLTFATSKKPHPPQDSTFGRDLATVNLELKVRGHDLIGRQSQTWLRFPDHRWKVIAAHMLTVSEKPFW